MNVDPTVTVVSDPYAILRMVIHCSVAITTPSAENVRQTRKIHSLTAELVGQCEQCDLLRNQGLCELAILCDRVRHVSNLSDRQDGVNFYFQAQVADR